MSPASRKPILEVDFNKLSNPENKKRYEFLGLKIEKIETRHLCIQCHDLANDPVDLKCQHLLDRSCLQTYVDINKDSDQLVTCVACKDENRKEITTFDPQETLPTNNNMINEISKRYTVCCPRNAQGCTWQNKYKALDKHLNEECLYRQTTPFDKANNKTGAPSDITSDSDSINNLPPEIHPAIQKYLLSVLEPIKRDQDNLVKEIDKHRKIIKQQERSIEELTKKVIEKHFKHSAFDELCQLQSRCLEPISYNGRLIWKINDYRKRKTSEIEGKTTRIFSQPFYTNPYGYKICASLFLNGNGMGTGSCISIFINIMKGDYDQILKWPLNSVITFFILGQDGCNNHLAAELPTDPNNKSFSRPMQEMNIATGIQCFALQSDIESKTNSYLKRDTLFIKVEVDTRFSDYVHGCLRNISTACIPQNPDDSGLQRAGYNGQILWKIDDYNSKMEEARKGSSFLQSQPFFTSNNNYGYKLCLRFYPKGDEAGRCTLVKLCVMIMKGECDHLLKWPLKQKAKITLIDQTGRGKDLTQTLRADPASDQFQPPDAETKVVAYCQLFWNKSVLDHCEYYLRKNKLFIKAEVDTDNLDDPIHFSKVGKTGINQRQRAKSM